VNVKQNSNSLTITLTLTVNGSIIIDMINGNLQNQKILALQQQYLTLSVGKSSLLKIISESEIAEQVYNSNAIENSTLTFEETDKILLEIDLDRFINQREMFEAKNLARVVQYIYTKAKERELDQETILFLHKILINNINDDIAGRFRIKEWVRVGSFVAPSPDEVVDRITKLLIEYNTSQESITKKVAKFHLGFEYIHPFVDGNGRIGRVLNNFLLIRASHVPIIINYSDRPQYYQSFKEFQQLGESATMEKLVGFAVINSYYKRIAYLENQKITTLKDYSLTSKDSLSNLINKANRQTIPAFRQNGKWLIGV
jgi:Fic family protein